MCRPRIYRAGIALLTMASSLAAHTTIMAAVLPEKIVTHVRFLDQAGLPVTDIAIEEVELLEDGVAQEIVEFYPCSEPFRIGLLWDISFSMRAGISEIRYCVREFLLNLPEQHPVLLLTFDSDVYVDSDWTLDREALDQAASYVGKHPGKDKGALFEAISLGVRQKYRSEQCRQALVLLADGHDSGSDGISKEDALTAVKQGSILLYALQYDTRDHDRLIYSAGRGPVWEPPLGSTGRDIGGIFVGAGRPSQRDRGEYVAQSRYKNARSVMMGLAQAGRGKHFEVGDPTILSTALRKVEVELSSVYTLVHYPQRLEGSREFRNVLVVCNRDGVRTEQISGGYSVK